MVDLEKENDKYSEIVKQKRLDVFGLSQEDFAARFNVPVGTLRNWEQGLNKPPAYFMQLIAKEEAEIRKRYKTPMSELHDDFDNEPDHERVMLRREARKKINDDPEQIKIYGLLKTMLQRDGIIDNLQSISGYFNDTKPSDIAAIAQLTLLKDISLKLGHIERMLEKMK